MTGYHSFSVSLVICLRLVGVLLLLLGCVVADVDYLIAVIALLLIIGQILDARDNYLLFLNHNHAPLFEFLSDTAQP
jgi:hypothetical protein